MEKTKGKLKGFRKTGFIMLALLLTLVLTVFLTAVAQEKPPSPPAKEQIAERVQTVGSNLGLSGKLGDAVAKTPAGTGKGQIDVKCT